MKLSTVLHGQTFSFSSVKEVLAKANEEKSGDILAGLAAASGLERIAAKVVLSEFLVSDLRENPVVPYEDDEVTRMIQDGVDEEVYRRIRGWTMAQLREYILDYNTTEQDLKTLSRGLTAEVIAGVCKLMSNLDLIYALHTAAAQPCYRQCGRDHGITAGGTQLWLRRCSFGAQSGQ